jgi:hypothetical protein
MNTTECQMMTTQSSCQIALLEGLIYQISIFDGSTGKLLSHETFDFILSGPVVTVMDETQINDMIRALTEQAAKYTAMKLQMCETEMAMGTEVEFSVPGCMQQGHDTKEAHGRVKTHFIFDR